VYVPPTDVPDVSRFSIVADPQAATLALVKWLNPGQEQPAAPTSPGHVGWHELSAVDWEKAFAFYVELFGWQKVDADFGESGTYLLFSAGGHSIGGMFTKPPTVPMPFWLYYFNVGDLDAAAKRVKAGGGKILEGPIEARGGNRIARCTDPQGAMFALRAGRPNPVGYFGRAAADDPAATRLFVPKKAGPNA
jgi:predicted enzyme related to lactoylglutathione lyase